MFGLGSNVDSYEDRYICETMKNQLGFKVKIKKCNAYLEMAGLAKANKNGANINFLFGDKYVSI
jgi:hypothetical protein